MRDVHKAERIFLLRWNSLNKSRRKRDYGTRSCPRCIMKSIDHSLIIPQRRGMCEEDIENLRAGLKLNVKPEKKDT